MNHLALKILVAAFLIAQIVKIIARIVLGREAYHTLKKRVWLWFDSIVWITLAGLFLVALILSALFGGAE